MATGLLTLLAAIGLWGSQRTPRTALALLLAAGLASVALMSAVNFAILSEFRWLLLAPALAWTMAVVLLVSIRQHLESLESLVIPWVVA